MANLYAALEAKMEALCSILGAFSFISMAIRASPIKGVDPEVGLFWDLSGGHVLISRSCRCLRCRLFGYADEAVISGVRHLIEVRGLTKSRHRTCIDAHIADDKCCKYVRMSLSTSSEAQIM